MPALALAIVGIALPDSLNPSLIVGAMYLTLGPHPVRRTLAFTIGAFAVTLAGGALIALGLADLVLSLLPKLSRKVKYELLTVTGVLLVCGSVVVWLRRNSLGASEPPSKGQPPQGGSALLMGAGIAAIEFVTAFPYFAAIALVIGSSVSLPGKTFLIVLYNVIYVLPLIAIAALYAVMGERARPLLDPIGDWIAMRWPVVVAPLACIVGAALITYGLLQLM